MTEQGRILIVEDDKHLGILLQQYLKQEGYLTTLGHNGHEALNLLDQNEFDVCIFDIMMPGMDGFELARNVKNKYPQLPFLFLTAREQKMDKLKGYELGAEDYITKPFDDEELLWKLKVIMRRAQADGPKDEIFQISSFTFDPARLELCRDGECERLTETENKVLHELCTHKNRILRRDDAVERIYGKRDYFLGRSFDVFISKIRKRFSVDPAIEIENVYKVGFILKIAED